MQYEQDDDFHPPAQTTLQSAREHLARLEGKMPMVPIFLNDDPFDFMLQVQHYMHRGFYVADESIIERQDGSMRGVCLYAPLAAA